MAINKTKKADLVSKSKRIFEISLIISLALLIAAFKFFPDIEKLKLKKEDPPIIIDITDVLPTQQDRVVPPPPKPPIPIESPSAEVLEDIEIGDTEIDITEQISPPPPPPVEDRKIVEKEEIFFVVAEDMPEPIGGLSEIQKKIKYPELAIKAGIEGRVIINAFVDEFGVVNRAKIFKGIQSSFITAASDALLKTKFKPGLQRGKPVKVQVKVPVFFKLQ